MKHLSLYCKLQLFLLKFFIFSLFFLLYFFVLDNATAASSSPFTEFNQTMIFPEKASSYKEKSLLSKNLQQKPLPEKEVQTYVEGELLVKYKEEYINFNNAFSSVKETLFLSGKGLKRKEVLKNLNVSVLLIEDNTTVEDKIQELKNNENIEYIQPNYIYNPASIPTNDLLKDLLWGLDNTGQVVDGVSGISDIDIDAPEAWVRSMGEGAIVAVIDTGVDYTHPDLVGSMWNGVNCVNDLGGVLGGCNHGYDYVSNDKSPLPGDFRSPVESHGTHIAGTVAATSNNSLGVVGVAPEAKIMALRTNLTTSQIVKSIGFAEQNGAKVINASWGGSYYDTAILNAINSFSGLFITAAGNGEGDEDPEGDNHDRGETLHFYPCDYTLENILCVAATDQNDSLAYFSDFGTESVDVGAPGVNIYSTTSYNYEIVDDFSGVTPLELPSYLSRGGNNNYWGVRRLIAADGVTVLKSYLYGDTYKPYYANSNTYVKTSSFNLLNKKASLYFDMICDNELSYGSSSKTDYMYVSLSADNGDTWGNSLWWDEYVMEYNMSGSYRPIGFTHYVAYDGYEYVIPAQYLTSGFTFAFGWVSDSSINDFWGCGISNLILLSSNGGYYSLNGTSMATPHVAGIAALLKGYRPGLSTNQIKEAIVSSGDSVESLTGKTVTGKRVNAFNALNSVRGDVISTFKFTEGTSEFSCDITEKTKSIDCRIPGDVPKTNQAPTIALTGGSILPSSGTPNNFYTSNTYSFSRISPYTATEQYTVNVEDYFRTHTRFRSGIGNWGVVNTKYSVSGDFNGDSTDEIAAIYDYGKEDMSIIVFDQGEQQYPTTWFRSGVGNWGVPNTKYVTAGDFNGDGKDEIAAMYDYGREDMAIIIFSAENSKFTPSTWFRSGVGNWGVPYTKYVTVGDFNGDGKDEISAMYDYGRDDMAIIVFDQGEQQYPSTWFRSGVGNWGVANTRYSVSGDFNTDGKDELTAMYDYGNDDMAIIVFDNGKQQYPSTWFRSGVGNWGVPNTKYVTTGDFNGDGIDQLVTMYDYGGEDMAMIMFSPSGSTFTNSTWFRSGTGNWGVPYTKHLSAGDYNGNGIDEISSFYDYGQEDMGVILFK